MALPRTPLSSLVAGPWVSPLRSVCHPPAAQWPAGAHDTELRVASPPPLFRAAGPGQLDRRALRAVPYAPRRSLATNP